MKAKTSQNLTSKKSASKSRHLNPKKNWEEILKTIKTPHVTEKATMLEQENKYVLKIPSKANKISLRKALFSLYGKKIVKISIINVKPKQRKRGRKIGYRSGYKKAIITLKKGEKLDFFRAKSN